MMQTQTRKPTWTCTDGNEAAARIAYALSEVIAIYPITPASPMGEFSDAWSASGRKNLWGVVPEVVEMQSEAGAAGAVHGALLKGALATTFTASQGLLLMLPNMFKIAGELTPAVIHVAARSVATHALSIFGDHSDVMAARSTGWAMLASSSVQEAQDMALIAHTATLEARVPFIHFFDGFRTSHEVNKIDLVDDGQIRAMIDDAYVRAHRARGLSPDAPVLRGSAQNPDVFFQNREAANDYYAAVPGTVADAMERFARLTGRRYDLVEYVGAPDADRVIVAMGSGVGAIEEAVERLTAAGERVGLLKVRLFRPFPVDLFSAFLPETVRHLAVLDRTKEPGAVGEPLYQDVVAALARTGRNGIRVVGGRYGLSSKEFTPAMAKAVFENVRTVDPAAGFTVGIEDDVTRLSLDYDATFSTEPDGTRALFYGLGSDGTVSANKNSVKIVGEETSLHAQGYFVYDSKKSGSTTVSHLRFSELPIRSTYLVDRANFVACHQFGLLEKIDILERAERGATLLLNAPYEVDDVWGRLPEALRERIVEKDIELYAINAYKLARELGLGARINTIMQPCFFALTDVLPRNEAIAGIKRSIEKQYGSKGRELVELNLRAVDTALKEMHRVIPSAVETSEEPRQAVTEWAPSFVKDVTTPIMIGKGDTLPVSVFPVDGTFPTGTSRWEKRGIAQDIPVWDPSLCIDCGHCTIVCPHAALRMKVYDPDVLQAAPDGFISKDFHAKEVKNKKMTIQVSPLDCTGCNLCVEVCPAKSKTEAGHKALDMIAVAEAQAREEENWSYFEQIPDLDPALLDPSTVKGSQVRKPLFEFSGACAGCGETPYLKLLTQLFGDRMIVANATGCSSIYGGNLPTTPWSTNDEGRGPAWANSLFEDNAEFGYGIRVAHDKLADRASVLLEELKPEIDPALVEEIVRAEQNDEAEIAAQRERVARVKEVLRANHSMQDDRVRELFGVIDEIVRKSVWIVGGDGWAYDIGSAGLDHVLASGRNVNILVLDTEVYSNTGGQASKATPRGAVAKFAANGKRTMKKDLGAIAALYGNVYVAQVALGANYTQTIKALIEAEAWSGPSLIIAYSTCIAHGIEMATSMRHQKDAVASGYWPLYRHHPGAGEHEHPFHLDSKKPTGPVASFAASEARFAMLARSDPEAAAELMELQQRDIDERWRLYEQMAGQERTMIGRSDADEDGGETRRPDGTVRSDAPPT